MDIVREDAARVRPAPAPRRRSLRARPETGPVRTRGTRRVRWDRGAVCGSRRPPPGRLLLLAGREAGPLPGTRRLGGSGGARQGACPPARPRPGWGTDAPRESGLAADAVS